MSKIRWQKNLFSQQILAVFLLRHLPNALTLSNLFFGIAGIYFAFHELLWYSSICIGIAAVADFLDGFVARLLKVSSPIGKELDSLADMVSFGVLPGVIAFVLIQSFLGVYFVPLAEQSLYALLISLTSALIPLFSALRLAKFNVDTRQTDGFIGVPTPANALFFAGFPLILELQFDLNIYPGIPDYTMGVLLQKPWFSSAEVAVLPMLTHAGFYASMSLLWACMLVAPIPMIAFKFKGFAWSKNKEKYLFLILVLALLLFTLLPYAPFLSFLPGFPYIDYVVMPLILLLYLFYGLLAALISQFKKT